MTGGATGVFLDNLRRRETGSVVILDNLRRGEPGSAVIVDNFRRGEPGSVVIGLTCLLWGAILEVGSNWRLLICFSCAMFALYSRIPR